MEVLRGVLWEFLCLKSKQGKKRGSSQVLSERLGANSSIRGWTAENASELEIYLLHHQTGFRLLVKVTQVKHLHLESQKKE